MQWSEYLHKSTGTKKTSFSSQLTSKQLKDQRSHQTEKSSNEGSQTFLDLMSHPSWIKGQPKKHYASCFLKPPWLLETTKQLYTWSSGWFQNHSQHWRVPCHGSLTYPGQSLDTCLIRLSFSSSTHPMSIMVLEGPKFHPHTTFFGHV